jgi:transcription initiation factor TFIIE subunit alpha
MIEGVISELVGEEVVPLVNMLKNHKNVSEFQIATKIKMPVDVIRNHLYRLHNHHLVLFNRKKDKKKGWYIYYWTINLDQIKYLVNDLKRKKIEALKERILREQNGHFFSCGNRCVRVDFEQATNFGYKCPECGEILNQEDNSQKIKDIEKEISSLSKELSVPAVDKKNKDKK